MSKYEFIDSQNAVAGRFRRGEDVPLAGRLDVRVLSLAHPPAIGHRGAPAALLTARVQHFFEESEGTYGYRRIHADLAAEQTECSPELVRQIMRANRAWWRVNHARSASPPRLTLRPPAGMPDLVHRDFTADRPGVKFVGDITYIHTWQGFVYLATVIDCYSKKVVGWSIADHMRTELVEPTRSGTPRHPRPDQPAAIWHSDRGSVYTSADFRALVTGLGMRSSMGRTGVCWDNSHGRNVLLGPEKRARLPHGLRHQGTSPAGMSFATSRASTTAGAVTRHSVTGGPTRSTMVTSSRPRQRRETTNPLSEIS